MLVFFLFSNFPSCYHGYSDPKACIGEKITLFLSLEESKIFVRPSNLYSSKLRYFLHLSARRTPRVVIGGLSNFGLGFGTVRSEMWLLSFPHHSCQKRPSKSLVFDSWFERLFQHSDFSTMNFSTPDFSTPDFSTPKNLFF